MELIKNQSILLICLQKKPPCLIPFLIANCATILGGILGIVLLFVSPSDTATTNAGEDYTTSMTNEDDPVQGHRFIFISVAVVIILLNIHGWLVIFALYKSYSHPENKVVDNVMAEVAASYPPLQSVTKNMDAVRSSVATIDDGLRFTYK